MPDVPVARALTIAGSDSGGGAGIEADLKTFTALGVYGMVALTSVTAQNTRTVSGIHDLPPAFVAEQIDVVASDIGMDAAKTGMLSSADIVGAVADSIERNGIEKLVVDPVMVAKSGDALLHESAQDAVKRRMLPLAWVLTPNVPEAEVLSGLRINGVEDIAAAAEAIVALGPRYVLMKGGHLEGNDAADFLYGPDGAQEFRASRIDTKNTHGTGCTYSAAIAAYLAMGYDTPQAVARAKDYLTTAIERSLSLGHGHGPLNHFWPVKPL